MNRFDLSITICSWNTIDDLRECLSALRRAQDEAIFEVIVIDNNSEDGSPQMVTSEFPEFRLERQFKNLGFTGGHNLAIELSQGRHILLLNSDAFVHPGAIRQLLEFTEAHPEAGIIGPQLLNLDGTLQHSCRTFPNPMAAVFRNTILGRFFPQTKWVREYLMSDWDHQSPREVDWVSGAALLITEQALPKLKGLDPEFFMYMEDVDLCLRCWRSGFKVLYTPDPKITHKIGTSTSKAPNRMIYRFHASMFLFYRKHYLTRWPLALRPVGWLVGLLGVICRAGLFILKNKIDVARRKLG